MLLSVVVVVVVVVVVLLIRLNAGKLCGIIATLLCNQLYVTLCCDTEKYSGRYSDCMPFLSLGITFL